jgi:23S rRNA (cytidine1920-2'-O)/16S rRNA (cytidine1409-2'-O)-methyltransferase
MTAKTTSVKERLDHMLVARGLVRSRELACRLIMAGKVLVNGRRLDKQAARISTDATIEIPEPLCRFVSRAGDKLDAAIKAFDVDCSGLTALDVGSSTGGFTDCLLQHGARRVYAVDVGFGQLDWSLRQDPRVVLLERRNIRYLEAACIP